MEIPNTMTVKSVKIEKLFEIFDYNIEYPADKDVLIITGPNGFGKTQILNILNNLFNHKFEFFEKLVFKKITIYLSEDFSIGISKNIENGEDIEFIFFDGSEEFETFKYTVGFRKLIEDNNYFSLRKSDEGTWIDDINKNILTSEDVFRKYLTLPTDILNDFSVKIPEISRKAKGILNSVNVHLISDQRLQQYDEEQDEMLETIVVYSGELHSLMSKKIQQSYSIAQELDSSYPNRLISTKIKISKENYNQKFSELRKKQDKLAKYGLYENTQEELEYSSNDAKALLVYLSDLEKKLSAFDDLLEKLALFTDILNQRRFTFKSIYIDRERGFYFKTSKGKKLGLSELSLGEKHEVILLYELIFKTRPGILVLIDEPEISLHITWQKEFLDDLLKIIKIQNFQVLIATHSPSIINDHWDLVYNLETTESK